MKQKSAQSIIAFYEKESPSATEFRRIYSSLSTAVAGKQLRTILVTSATLGEGKSIISSLLAITIASLVKSKVAIVDIDLRRPRLQDYFAVPPAAGVADVLTGKADIKSVARATGIPNLSVITSGRVAMPASDVFDQADLPAFIRELKFYFDTIVIDSPPVIPVSDPMLIADQVDGVLMVIKSGSTQREVVKRALNLLGNTTANLLGIVLNDVESVLPYYYKDRYYGYHYSYSKKR